ncbi:MAG: AAA family ATPase [Alphaproteobacteria bacterium]|nr:AAA family ATPase [Alphaproteobacteria bacterium]
MSIAVDSPGPPVGRERRYLTIVFSDLVGYTQLSENMDPEDLRELQLRYQRLALTAMEEYGGFVAAYSGDGILVYFGYPTAHENDAERAVRGALELVKRVPEIEARTYSGSIERLSVRIGVHTGLLVIGPETLSAGRREYGVVGEAVNLAARLKEEAPIDSVVVTKETLELIDGLFDSEPLGDRRVRGLSRTVALHRVVRPRYAAGRTAGRMRRGATQMVGREREAEQLMSYWHGATQQSRCTMVQVVGEAGVGKTRLVQDFCQRPPLSGATVLRLNCLELFATAPLYAVASFFWLRVALSAEDNDAARMTKISSYLSRFDAYTPENAAILANLLGFAEASLPNSLPPTPLAVKQAQFAFLTWLFGQLVRKKPTVLWIDDAHWLDPSSAELLPRIVEQLANAPVLVLLTTRSFPRNPTLPEPDHVIALEQLEREQCLQLAKSVPGAQAVSDDLLSRAVAACDGIPLFIEQMVLSLISQSSRSGGKAASRGELPLTLGEMMSERLDRLEGGRRVVQAAACIGRSFSADFLGSLLDDTTLRVLEPLEALVAGEILRRRLADGTTTYEFRHVLLQRVAYESMVHADRRDMHANIAGLLKQRSNAEPVIPEVMAHHLTQAGRAHEAIEAWLEAAAGASRRSALVEAIAHVRSGLALLKEVADPHLRHELELGLQTALIGPLSGAKGGALDEISECCERGMELSLRGEPSSLVFPFMFGQFTFLVARGRTAEAVSLAERFLSLAGRLSNASALVVGHRLAGMGYLHQGELGKGKWHCQRALELYSAERDEAATHMFGQNLEVHSRCLLGLSNFLLGEIDVGLQGALDALQLAEKLNHAHSTALALSYVGVILGMSGATDALMGAARRLTAVSEKHGLDPFLTVGKAFVGWSLCQRADFEQGIAVMDGAIAAAESAAGLGRLGLARYLAMLADAQRRHGQLEAAEATCARAVEAMASDSKWVEPEVRRVQALIIRDRRPQDLKQAEISLELGLECTRMVGLPMFELRCLVEHKAMFGARRDMPEVDRRIAELSAYRDVDRRAAAAVRAHAPSLYLDEG